MECGTQYYYLLIRFNFFYLYIRLFLNIARFKSILCTVQYVLSFKYS